MADESRIEALGGSAMQQAVSAEQQARQAITDAEAEAAASVEQARAQARALLNAVPERIARLRARGARAVEQALREIQAEEAAALQTLGETAFPAALLDEATRVLVTRLTEERVAGEGP